MDYTQLLACQIWTPWREKTVLQLKILILECANKLKYKYRIVISDLLYVSKIWNKDDVIITEPLFWSNIHGAALQINRMVLNDINIVVWRHTKLTLYIDRLVQHMIYIDRKPCKGEEWIEDVLGWASAKLKCWNCCKLFILYNFVCLGNSNH